MEFILEILIEIILQLVSEFLFAGGVHGVRRIRGHENEYHPALSFVGYAVFGAIVGGISV